MSNSLIDTRAILALAAPNDAVCYAATDAGLWRLKRGKSAPVWKQIAPQFAALGLTSVAAAGTTVLIGAAGDIAVSQDAGESWGLATLPLKAETQALAVSPDFARDRLVLAATLRDGVLRSVDGGATFHAWNFGLLDLRINALAFSPAFADDGTVLAAGDNAVFVSRNGGRAWRELALPEAAAPFTAVSLLADGGVLIGTESAGLWRASSVDDAAVRDTTFKSEAINAMLGAHVAADEGVYALAKGKWRRISTSGNAFCLAHCGAALFAGTMDAGVFDATA